MPGRNESYMQIPAKLTFKDAQMYLHGVKSRFQGNREVYDTFLEVMKQFKAGRLDTAGVIVQVKQLLKGHNDLISGFGTFLPMGYETQLLEGLDDTDGTDKAPSRKLHRSDTADAVFESAIGFLNKVRERFEDNRRVYNEFLDVLKKCRMGEKTTNEVHEEVAVLFRLHHDLIQEFQDFLPNENWPVTSTALSSTSSPPTSRTATTASMQCRPPPLAASWILEVVVTAWKGVEFLLLKNGRAQRRPQLQRMEGDSSGR